MAHRLKTPEGRKLYALRKQIPEPVFGIIKSVMGFRQFLLRGLDEGPGRVEPGDHGVEHEAAVRPRRRGLTKNPASWRILAHRRPAGGTIKPTNCVTSARPPPPAWRPPNQPRPR